LVILGCAVVVSVFGVRKMKIVCGRKKERGKFVYNNVDFIKLSDSHTRCFNKTWTIGI
jgi:hypothetical protein